MINKIIDKLVVLDILDDTKFIEVLSNFTTSKDLSDTTYKELFRCNPHLGDFRLIYFKSRCYLSLCLPNKKFANFEVFNYEDCEDTSIAELYASSKDLVVLMDKLVDLVLSRLCGKLGVFDKTAELLLGLLTISIEARLCYDNLDTCDFKHFTREAFTLIPQQLHKLSAFILSCRTSEDSQGYADISSLFATDFKKLKLLKFKSNYPFSEKVGANVLLELSMLLKSLSEHNITPVKKCMTNLCTILSTLDIIVDSTYNWVSALNNSVTSIDLWCSDIYKFMYTEKYLADNNIVILSSVQESSGNTDYSFLTQSRKSGDKNVILNKVCPTEIRSIFSNKSAEILDNSINLSYSESGVSTEEILRRYVDLKLSGKFLICTKSNGSINISVKVSENSFIILEQ